MSDLQRTEQWFAERCGRVTASRVADVVARTKTGWSTSRANYKAQLVCERLTGVVEPGYINGPMQWGLDQEASARDAYCFYRDADVLEVGFIRHPTIEMSGASPDGYVGEDGLVEIKAPITATHIETLLGQSVPSKYLTQIQWQLACTERAWCDFVSFDPRLPAEMQIFVQRIERDDTAIGGLEAEVSDFLGEVDATVAELRARYEREAA
jgi:putative phage-type endonuclease